MELEFSETNYQNALQLIEDYENEINQYYSIWETLTVEEKREYLLLIQDLRTVIEEVRKFVALYENLSEQEDQDFFEYTVKEEDNLPYLANRFFENETGRWKDIYNDNALSDIKIIPGQKLKIRNE